MLTTYSIEFQDPIQSVKGKVVIDAFRTINPQMIMLGQEPRQTTSNLGHLQKPSIQGEPHFEVIFDLVNHFSPHSWTESTLLLDANRLPQE